MRNSVGRLRSRRRQPRQRLLVEPHDYPTPLALGRVRLESGQLVAFEHSQAREAGELLELVGVFINPRIWHAAARGYKTWGRAWAVITPPAITITSALATGSRRGTSPLDRLTRPKNPRA